MTSPATRPALRPFHPQVRLCSRPREFGNRSDRMVFKKLLSGFSKSRSANSDNTVLRKLQPEDYNKGYLNLLGQLTVVGDYDESVFNARFEELKAQPDTYVIVVIEDTANNKIIGTATLFIEKKFIRGCAKCGHIEDVVVDSTYRGLRLGARVVEACMEEAEKAGCYKVILDCSEKNAPFYEKCGLIKKEIQMVRYLGTS